MGESEAGSHVGEEVSARVHGGPFIQGGGGNQRVVSITEELNRAVHTLRECDFPRTHC